MLRQYGIHGVIAVTTATGNRQTAPEVLCLACVGVFDGEGKESAHGRVRRRQLCARLAMKARLNSTSSRLASHIPVMQPADTRQRDHFTSTGPVCLPNTGIHRRPDSGPTSSAAHGAAWIAFTTPAAAAPPQRVALASVAERISAHIGFDQRLARRGGHDGRQVTLRRTYR